jgi:tetratricopeptide (TPR) repeat protein
MIQPPAHNNAMPGAAPLLNLLFFGKDIELQRWIAILAARTMHLPIRFLFNYSLASQELPGPAIMVLDCHRLGDAPDQDWLAQVSPAASEKVRGLCLLNLDSAAPGAWEPLLGQAVLLTSSSRAVIYALLDRGLRCVELGPALNNIHLALIEAMIRRELEKRPAVSWVTPLFNTRLPHLTELIESVLAQDDPDWELILLDNGDPEMTRPVAESYADPRIRYYGDLGGRGIAMGRNLGNMLATGRFIAVMDHDDLAAPERVSAIKSTLSGDDAIMYSDVEQIFPGGARERKKLKLFSSEELRRDCNIYHPSVAYSWELAAQIPYDPRFEPADDYRVYLAALRRGKKLVHVPKPLLIYRRHAGQYSRSAQGRLSAAAGAVRGEDRYLRNGGDPLDRAARFGPLARNFLASACDSAARELIELGYGAPYLQKTADFLGQGSARVDEGHLGPEAYASIISELKPEEVREAAWIILKREGEQAAAMLLKQALNRDMLGPEDSSDLGDLLFRQGDIQGARTQLKLAQEHGRSGLAAHQLYLVESWQRIMGEAAPDPPPAQVLLDEDKPLSVIIASAAQDQERINRTMKSLQSLDPAKFEAILMSDEAGPFPGAQWNLGLGRAKGQCLMFLAAGDEVAKEFPERALKILLGAPAADAALGQVNIASADLKLPGRFIGPGPMLRDERAMLCGCIFRKSALLRIGAFMPGLGPACGWELMVRAFKGLSLVQLDESAATSARPPLSPAFIFADRESFRANLDLFFLVKHIHSPLRRLDLDFSGAPPEFMDQRFSELSRIALHSPSLLSVLDPWEYLAEFNTPYHLLYRLGLGLDGLGRFREARAAYREAIRLKPREPKLWTRWLLASFRSLT